MSQEKRKQIGITLTHDTLERLNAICEETGLTKSQAISLLINNEYVNKYADK